LSENSLKLTYGNLEFQNFPGKDPRISRSKGTAGSVEEGGKGDREVRMKWWKGRAKGKERGEKGSRREWERNLDPLPDVPDRSTSLQNTNNIVATVYVLKHLVSNITKSLLIK
jgi:hypothetical protein